MKGQDEISAPKRMFAHHKKLNIVIEFVEKIALAQKHCDDLHHLHRCPHPHA
jgi:hypothetical protein